MACAGLVTVSRLAEEIAACLAESKAGGAEARRLAFSFIEYFDKAPPVERQAMIDGSPASVGDSRFDALLGALVEHVCVQEAMGAPGWVNEPARFLETWWFISGLGSLHADALVHSPISFARRGIFVTEGALTYA